MPSFAREFLAIDRRRVDLRAGVVGVLVLSAFGVAIAFVVLGLSRASNRIRRSKV